MKRIISAAVLAALIACAAQLAAQTAATGRPAAAKTPTVILEYFDDAKQVRIFNADGFEYGELFPGMELLPGDRLQLQKTSAELRLDPNGSIIKLTANTNFQINSLKIASGSVNEFAVLAGKIRTVAAKSSGSIDYRFRTPTAIGGVRGTDFGIEVRDGQMDRLIVRDGSVEFTRADTGQTITLDKGTGADTFAKDFKPSTLTTKDLADFYNDLEFVALNPATVPSAPSPSPSPSASASPSATPAASPAASPAPTTPAQPATPSSPSTSDSPAAATPATAPVASSASAPAIPAAPVVPPLSDAVLDAVKRFLGIEIGAITIQNETYGKLILQPRINLPDFKAQFYLPVIYQDNLFDPAKWYHPSGNDEWSFGTDQGSDALEIVWDIFRDMFLKIKYVELFKQGDPFFLKVGNIPSMTLGHGILVGGYANDADFPAVRRLGVNTGFDLGAVSLEALVNDLADPQIFGARLVWRPVAPAFRTGAGVSAALDINPAGSLPATSSDADILATRAAAPMFLNLAADIEIPVVGSDPFSLMLFGDFGGMLPYFATGFNRSDGTAVPAGFQLANAFSLATSPAIGITFNNYGIEGGLKGNVFFVDYRLAYQYFTGTFRPSFYDQVYDRLRGQRAVELYRNIRDAVDDDTVRMGIFGQLGFSIEKLLRFEVGYKYPWNLDSAIAMPADNPDYFMASFRFEEDALPFGIGFSLGFERQYFVPLFTKSTSYLLLDQYAVFSGALEVPIGNFFKIRMVVGTSAQRDSSGMIVLSDGRAVMKPTFTIESIF
jgi:hypothetical protein